MELRFGRRPAPHRPTAAPEPAELAALIERYFRRNFVVNLLDGALFTLGMSFFAYSTIVPLFISKLTSSTVPIALAAMIAQGGWMLPQLFTANWAEQMQQRKPAVVRYSLLLERVPVWLMMGAALLANRSAILALVVFLLAFALRGLGGGAVGPAWLDMIARIIPVEKRGRLVGLMFFLGTGSGLAGSVLSAWFLDRYAFPYNFALNFGVAAVIQMLSWIVLNQVYEPEWPANPSRQNQRQFFAGLLPLLQGDKAFRRFLSARGLMCLGNMGAGFLVVAAVQRWSVPDSTVGIYTGAQLLGQMLGTPVIGYLADRFGHKLSLELSAFAFLLAFTLAWQATAAAWYYVVFVLLGVAMGAVLVSGSMSALEYATPDRRPTYVGIANSAMGVIYMAGPLLAVGLVSAGYGLIFALSAAFNLLALVALVAWVQDPRSPASASQVRP
jgi:MFS family permease